MTMKTKRTFAAIAAGAIAVSASPALAHSGGAAHGIWHGFVHPFAGGDHLIAMLAVGLWAATREPGRAWRAPAVFLACLLVGGLLGLGGGALAMVEPMIGASIFALAALVLIAPFVPERLGLALIGGFALLHGHAHGAEAFGVLPAYFAGFVVASAALHLIGWRIGTAIAVTRAGRIMAAGAIGIAGIGALAG